MARGKLADTGPDIEDSEQTIATEPLLQEEAPVAENRTPEYGDGVLWVDNRERSGEDLKATIMAVFAYRSLVSLRVYDSRDPFGYFDVHQVSYDANKAPGTWHW